MSRSGPTVCPATGDGEAGVSLAHSSNVICKLEIRDKKRDSPLAGQRDVPGLPLHQKEATGLHDYGKAQVEDDGEQQRRRDELARRAIRC